ncbi:hypothetical protein BB559_002655 [Furculomyces boomerangus]|uniref:Dol-P-Glc:Glc(2)Man(9)GlcNAc(2)-PP-Dol alpha-1,2-glucosyltransferase n=2 Tax=Harpellales TaxID=61421 RepID=A0A2T9YTL7_9FUNG|nr:hypothetical protein BB559_004969 [Furculomyces boomerangus]PVU95687.1 hypothetical protein BB559_002655 [Furculomyces boomerangus]PWA01861.1 hypothetical protein BB558_001984 [Smittium angustum]
MNKIVQAPYMDEVFHAGQAQAYCNGQFSTWDPKLTTPPGLYIVSFILAKIVNFLGLSETGGCTIKSLRTYNYFFSLLHFLVVYSIIKKLNKTKSDIWIAVATFTLMVFPVSFFFSFMYYTETLSNLLVLYGYSLSLDKSYWESAAVFLASLFLRQTNIIYAAMVLGWSILAEVGELGGEEAKTLIIKNSAYSTRSLEAFVSPFKKVFELSIENIAYMMRTLSGFLIVFAVFGGFIAANNGIVLGDKSNHVATLHFPQIYYLIMFLAGMCFPTISRIVDPIYFFRKNFLRSWRLLLYVSISLLMLYTVKYHTIEHPFILSDNRHFSFYIWKDVYRRHYLIRYLLVPVYFYAGWLCWRALAKAQSIVWCLIAVGGVFLTLIPSPLLEFRYFILPYYIYRLHIVQSSKSRMASEICWNLSISIGVYYLFFSKPFTWPSEPNSVMRFMW